MSRLLIAALCGLGLVGMVLGADKTLKVELRLAENKSAEGLTEATLEGSKDKIYLHKEIVASNDDIADAQATEDANKAPAVEITFTEAGQKKVAAATGANVDKRLAVIVNGKVISAPIIKSQIGGKAVISGNFKKGEAEQLARGIRGQ